MRHVKLFVTCLVAVFVLGGVMAGAASAKEPKKDLLTLLSTEGEEHPAEVGSTSYGFVGVGTCVLASEGVLKSNSAKKDEAIYSTTLLTECEEGSGESISGSLSELQLSDKGAGELKGDVTYTLANKCAYTIKKVKFTFPTEGGHLAGTEEVSASGKNEKALKCEKKVTLAVVVGAGTPNLYLTSLTS